MIMSTTIYGHDMDVIDVVRKTIGILIG